MHTPPPPSPFKLLTKADVALVFSVCTKTIDNYVKAGLLPAPVSFGAREYWHPEVFQLHIDSVFVPPTGEVHDSEIQGEHLDAPAHASRPKVGGRADSSAVVRQQARQAGKLRQLNS